MARLKRLVIRKKGDDYQVITQLYAARGRHRIGASVLVPRKQLKAFLRDEGFEERVGLK